MRSIHSVLRWLRPAFEAGLELPSHSHSYDPTRLAARLRCRQCLAHITSDAERVSIQARHQHHCINPAGYRFKIGCFRAAPGCHETGAPTHRASWFAGFSWQISLCRRCGHHLGWRFEATQSSFYGLILNQLLSE